MGEIMRVDLDQLRAIADRVWDTAGDIDEMPWPALDPDALSGSAVAGVTSPIHIEAELADVVANMRGWAMAARLSADALEHADREHGERLGG
jgi:hypothetical protein